MHIFRDQIILNELRILCYENALSKILSGSKYFHLRFCELFFWNLNEKCKMESTLFEFHLYTR